MHPIHQNWIHDWIAHQHLRRHGVRLSSQERVRKMKQNHVMLSSVWLINGCYRNDPLYQSKKKKKWKNWFFLRKVEQHGIYSQKWLKLAGNKQAEIALKKMSDADSKRCWATGFYLFLFHLLFHIIVTCKSQVLYTACALYIHMGATCIDILCGKFHPIIIIKSSLDAKRVHVSVLLCLVVRFFCNFLI